jgi:hypothetical protein
VERILALEDFPQGRIDALREVANISPDVEQLAESFPLLFYLLAICWGPVRARHEAIRLLRLREPLKNVAEAMGVPYFLRHAPANAVPAALHYFRFSESAARELSGRRPRDPADTARWISGIYFAAAAGGQTFALWWSRQRPLFTSAPLAPEASLPLALYCWYSQKQSHALERLIDTHFQPDMSLSNAVGACHRWLQRVKLVAFLGSEGLADPWVEESSYRGWCFKPLATSLAIFTEASDQCNCLDTNFADALAANSSRLFSMRKKGHPTLTLELRPAVGNARSRVNFVIAQLEGYKNEQELPHDYIHIAWSWLRSRNPPLPASLDPMPREELERRLVAVLGDYVDARERDIAWDKMLGAESLKERLASLSAKTGRYALALNPGA